MNKAPAFLTLPEILIWSDPHLGHENIPQIAKRPFSSIEEHDEVMIENANKMISAAGQRQTVLFCLGDFAFGSIPKKQLYLSRLLGQKALIEGNHDDSGTRNLKGWQFVKQWYCTKHAGQRLFLSHYALRTWEGQHKGAWNLFGHSHGQLKPDPRLLAQDCGVDVQHLDGTRYRPFHFEELQAMLGRYRPTARLKIAFGEE